MKKLLVGVLVLGMTLAAGIAMAQQKTQNKPNPTHSIDLSKANSTVNNVVNHGAVSTSTSTVHGSTNTIVGQPATVIHPAAAPSMKSVDRKVVPPPSK